jgi:type II secretory pathway component PulJ
MPSPAHPAPEESGYTVLESVVATALLVSVFVPAIGGLAHVVTTETAEKDVRALSLAQAAMERTLHERRFDDRTWTTDGERWTLRRSVESDDRLVTVTIRAWRSRPGTQPVTLTDREPIVELTTSRIQP